MGTSAGNKHASLVDPSAWPAAQATDVSNTTASNTNTTLVYGADAQKRSHGFGFIDWSYSGTPTGGNIQVTDSNGVVYLDQDITTGGPGFSPFFGFLPAGLAITITLVAGGAGVTGKIGRVEHYLR